MCMRANTAAQAHAVCSSRSFPGASVSPTASRASLRKNVSSHTAVARQERATSGTAARAASKFANSGEPASLPATEASVTARAASRHRPAMVTVTPAPP